MAQLVGAGCWFAVAADAFEACNDILVLHACYKAAYALEVAVAAAIELHLFQYSILACYLNVSRTGSVGCVCYCFHGFINKAQKGVKG